MALLVNSDFIALSPKSCVVVKPQKHKICIGLQI